MGYTVKKILKTDNNELAEFVHNVNSLDTNRKLKLTLPKLKAELGSMGKLWILYDDQNNVVGGIGIRINDIGVMNAGEISYMFMMDEHRSPRNLVLLLKEVLRVSKKYDMVYMTVDVKDKTMNRMLENSPRFFSGISTKTKEKKRMLNFWIADISNGKYTPEEQLNALDAKFNK